MDTSSPEQTPLEAHSAHDSHGHDLQKFFPSGAIAFFILLVALCLVIWFGIYFLMLERI